MSLEPGTRFGPYLLEAPLGAGGMGEVYRARDTRLDRIVAVKVLPPQLAHDPQFQQRFEQEARAISQLDHPHICALYDIGEHDGTSFLVMQYLEGDTLEARLRRAPLPLDQALRCAVQIAGALDRAHRAGIVHRDLKPGNVMLTKDGAKLLDFGLAKSTASPGVVAGLTMLPTTPPGLTAQGAILGTFQYMAPEQLEGQDADARTDIFAFGAVLYEMLTGRKAFEGKSQASLIGAILKDDPPAPSTLQPLAPRALDRVVRTCLEKDPDNRWQSARDLERELEWIAGSPTETLDIATGTSRQLQLTRLIAAIFALAFVVSAAVVMFRRPGAEPTNDSAIRFRVPTEADLFGGYYSNGFALSPDGRMLAYVDGTPQNYKLQLRSVDTLDSRTLFTAEYIGLPFWSPDNRSVGFFSTDGLKRVTVLDGTVQTICALPQADRSLLVSGGTWGEGDVIVFAVRPNLYRVPASGGAAMPLQLGQRQAGYRWPQFLPGGRRFLYLQVSPTDIGLFLGSLDDGTSVNALKVLDTTYMAQYAAPGHLLFVRDGSLLAQRFDPETASLSGSPVPLVQGVAVSPDRNLRNAGFSVSAHGLVYLTSSSRRRLTWLDRSGNPQGAVLGEPDNYDEAELSPDGQQIALEINDKNGFGEIWVMNADRGTRVPLTRTADSWEYSPRWSPDGRYIAYADGSSVSRQLADGSGAPEKLAEITPFTLVFPRDWTRDGRILFSKLAGGLFSLPATANAQSSAVNNDATNGRVSPDGRWLAYTSSETGRPEVYVRSFEGGPRIPVSTTGGLSPIWQQTGSELYYLAEDESIASVTIKRGERPDVSVPKTLFKLEHAQRGGAEVRPSFSTIDGQRFLVRVADTASAAPLTWLANWTALLEPTQ